MEAVSIPMTKTSLQNLVDVLDETLQGDLGFRRLYDDAKVRMAIHDECRSIVSKLASAVQLGLPVITVMTVDPPPMFRYSAGAVDIAMRDYHEFRMKVMRGVLEACKALPAVQSKNGQSVAIRARVEQSSAHGSPVAYNHLILTFVDVPQSAE